MVNVRRSSNAQKINNTNSIVKFLKGGKTLTEYFELNGVKITISNGDTNIFRHSDEAFTAMKEIDPEAFNFIAAQVLKTSILLHYKLSKIYNLNVQLAI